MRCSSLVDWPVYPRLAHTMRASNGGQFGADAALPAAFRRFRPWRVARGSAVESVPARRGTRGPLASGSRRTVASAFLRQGATAARPRRLRMSYPRRSKTFTWPPQRAAPPRGTIFRHGLSGSVIEPSQTSGICCRVMLRPRETSAISPKREAKRLRLSEDERALLQAMERELGRPLTEPEEHLALERARTLGMV